MDWKRILSRQTVLVAAAATVSIVVLLGIVLIVTGTQSVTCKPVDEDPWSNETKLANHPSEDYTALARFGGSLLIKDATSQRYLPIIVDSISFKPKDESNWSFLYMNSDCTKITLHIDERFSDLFVRQIDVNADIGDGSRIYCTARVDDIAFYKYSHYTCDELRSYHCHHIDGDDLASMLLVNQIEFEVYGAPYLIRIGEYSKKENKCLPPGL